MSKERAGHRGASRNRLLAGLAIAMAALALIGCGTQDASTERPRPVLVVQPGHGDGASLSAYPGEVRAREESALSFRVGGNLVRRLVDVGDTVKRGDSVQLGQAAFRVAAVVTVEPDRMTGTMNVGPRVMVSRGGLERSGLIQPGSRAAERYLLRLPQGGPSIARVRQRVEEVFQGARVADFRETHPTIERGLNRAAAKVRDADVIVLLGRKQDFIIGFCRPPHVAANARIIQVDPSPLEIGRNRGVDVGLVGDVTAIVEQISKEAAKYAWPELPWLDELRAARSAQAEWAEDLARAEAPMHALFVHKTLRSILRPDDCLVFDGGDFCHFGRSFLPALKPKRWFNVSSLGMLGSALPTALAAKIAYPNERIFMLTGDGAFGFNAMEFDTAVRHRLNIVALLGNDSAWGIDRQIQLGLYGRAVATDLRQTRYDDVVNGLGGYGEFVGQPEELLPALDRALNCGKPALLNVAVARAISPRAEAAIGRRKAAAK